MQNRLSSTILFVLGLAAIASRVASAQECPSASAPEQARQLAGDTFAEGQVHFNEGRFREALERFECSNSLVPHHNTLYNMGQCAQRLGDNAAAIGHFRSFLELYPDAEGVEEVRARLGRLEAEQGASPSPPPDETPEPQPPVTDTPAGEPETRMTLARRMAWVTLAVGAGIAIAGGGVYGGSVSRNGEYRDTNDEYNQDGVLTEDERSSLADLSDSGEAMESAGWALMGVGLAAMVTSIVLFAAFDGSETVGQAEGSAFAVSPLVLEEGGGLSVAGRF